MASFILPPPSKPGYSSRKNILPYKEEQVFIPSKRPLTRLKGDTRLACPLPALGQGVHTQHVKLETNKLSIKERVLYYESTQVAQLQPQVATLLARLLKDHSADVHTALEVNYGPIQGPHTMVANLHLEIPFSVITRGRNNQSTDNPHYKLRHDAKQNCHFRATIDNRLALSLFDKAESIIAKNRFHIMQTLEGGQRTLQEDIFIDVFLARDSAIYPDSRFADNSNLVLIHLPLQPGEMRPNSQDRVVIDYTDYQDKDIILCADSMGLQNVIRLEGVPTGKYPGWVGTNISTVPHFTEYALHARPFSTWPSIEQTTYGYPPFPTE